MAYAGFLVIAISLSFILRRITPSEKNLGYIVLLEITGNDIAALSDEDLRSLVGMLCESELRSRDLSPSAVTWGGNQDAADGGIDVRVKIQDGAPPGGFVPRTSIGFQVKKTDFTPGLIAPEMRPSGELRASISDLIDERGAYIIVSSGSDASRTALANRVKAMRSAVANKAGHKNLLVDFYDRSRVATWTRDHSGLVVWVRQKIGRSVPGWQPYSSWAASPDGVEDKYLLDHAMRLHTGVSDEQGIDVNSGIDRIREALRAVRGVVRLVGLSGVGKTRLVQALFDSRVGNHSLDPALVVYTDMKDNPSPQPIAMISDLIALRTRAIVVVDNCAPDLHRRITEVCRASDSRISAITVEYDVQDDEPEGTEVFRLEPSSVEIVSNLIARRFPEMAQLNVDRIAEFSGGNARIALAIANTIERHESLAGLQDEELFKRLFHQRQEHDSGLLQAAQACALLYSFQGEALNGDDAELPKIAAIIGISAQQLFAKVAQLKQRDIVQRRSVWRAILPHAIANRLATMALREIPLEIIELQFDTDRLLRSFSRRLGYLHESQEAKRISEKWLAKDGLLANVGRLTDLGFSIFKNIAPISPQTTLFAIERAMSEADRSALTNEHRISSILCSIAYEASLFDRCVAALIQLAIPESSNARNDHNSKMLEGLFYIVHSGTHATIEQRTAVVDGLLRSNQAKKRSLGLRLLQALLQTDHFTPMHSFEFGARVRNYGFWPNTRKEKSDWYLAALQLARQFVTKNDEFAPVIRTQIAQSLRYVWFLGLEIQEQFEAIASEIAENSYWEEGWKAIRSVLSRPPKKADAAAVDLLRAFEGRLRPKNLTEQMRTVVLSQHRGAFDYFEMDAGEFTAANLTAAREKAHNTAEELGKAICGEPDVFSAILPDLVKGSPVRSYPFGKGLAIASVDRRSIWTQLTQALANTEKDKRNVDALQGFLAGLSTVDQQLCETLLKEAVAHDTLGEWFPILQCSVAISAAGVNRLKRAARLGRAQPRVFYSLGFGRYADVISGDDLRTIVLSLSKQDNGYFVASEILATRFFSDQDQKKDSPSALVQAGCTLLSSPVFESPDNMHSYNLFIIAKACLQGSNGSRAAESLCKRLKSALTTLSFSTYGYDDLFQCIFQLQPRVALDVFFGDAKQTKGSRLDFHEFDDPSEGRKNALDAVSVDEVLRWCDEKPAERFPAISRAVPYLAEQKEGGPKWTLMAIAILKRAPDPLAVLKIFVGRFSPRRWSGSRAAIIESRLGLLDRLGELKNASVDDYAMKLRPLLVADIARERKSEDERDSAHDERFE